ncbi:MAG: hypothetical protein L3J39_03795 [Verrucomicrobiales bacterium]|nr:hypothetical protein [Verrucomicrobiales bacterium]
MKQASSIFNKKQREQIEKAVIAAESSTSCEIVPIVGTVSGNYDRSEDMIGLWFAAFSAVGVWLMLPLQLSEPGSWAGRSVLGGGLFMLAVVFLAFITGVVIANRVAWMKRWFTPRKQMQKQVEARARELFFDNRVHHTSGGTGLLIYLSLFESKAVVFGDQEILDKLGQKFLDQLCLQLTTELQQRHPADAMCQVIAEAGRQLSTLLPRAEGDVNELQDALVLIDEE